MAKILVESNELPGLCREAIRRELDVLKHVIAVRGSVPEVLQLGPIAIENAIRNIANNCANGVVMNGFEVEADIAAKRVVDLLCAFTYDTAHYTNEKLGERVHFIGQLQQLAASIVEAVLNKE